MGVISVRQLEPLRLPRVKEALHLRIPEVLLPAKINQPALINGVGAYLQSSFSRRPQSLLYCHHPGDGPNRSPLALAQLNAEEIITSSADYITYCQDLAARLHPTIAMFYCREALPTNPLLTHYTHFLEQFFPGLSQESRTFLDNASNADHPWRRRRDSIADSFLVATTSGEFTNVTVASSCHALLNTSLARVRKDPTANSLYSPGWGLYGCSWHEPDLLATNQKELRVLQRAEFSLSPQQLDRHSIENLVSACLQWLAPKILGTLTTIAEIIVMAPNLALQSAFILALTTIDRSFRAKIALPDLLYGWSPMQNFLSLWSDQPAERLLINAEHFPKIHAYYVHHEGLPREN